MDSTTQLIAQLKPALGRRSTYVDLANGLRALILDGRLVAGTQLPPQRTLATALELSRTTVVSSLTLLRAEGFLTSRQGSGTTVRIPPDPVDRPDEPARPADDERATIDLTIAVLPAPSQVAAAAIRAAERLPAFVSGPGLHPLGLPELRAALAARLTARGLPTRPDQVLVTQGALHGWDLLLRTFSRPGARVLVEQPSLPAAIDAVRAHHARPQPIAVDAGGWQWPAGADGTAELTYVVPDFQNPTGHLADDGERRTLAKRARSTMLCVDETFVELGDEPVATPMGALDRRIVTIGSLSKLVWSGLRIGWVRGPSEVITRVAAARSSQDIAAPVLDQVLAVELMPELDAIRESRRTLLAHRRAAAVADVRAAGWQVVEPTGGLFLWAELNGASSTRLALAARAHGVRIPPGTRFSTSRTHDRYFRVPITGSPASLSDAIGRIVAAAEEPAGRTPAGRRPVWTI